MKNSDYWFVQTEIMKKELQSKFSVKENKIVVQPFYPPLLTSTTSLKKKPFTYLYVSVGTVHKNHIRLIDSFCLFYDKYTKGELLLTLGEEYTELRYLIDEKVKFSDFFSNNEMIFYKDIYDLIDKVNYYKKNERKRVQLGFNGKKRYF